MRREAMLEAAGVLQETTLRDVALALNARERELVRRALDLPGDNGYSRASRLGLARRRARDHRADRRNGARRRSGRPLRENFSETATHRRGAQSFFPCAG